MVFIPKNPRIKKVVSSSAEEAAALKKIRSHGYGEEWEGYKGGGEVPLIQMNVLPNRIDTAAGHAIYAAQQRNKVAKIGEGKTGVADSSHIRGWGGKAPRLRPGYVWKGEPPPGVAKPQVNYLFEKFKFIVFNATEDILDKTAKKIVIRIRASMKQGSYRPYISKRLKKYKGNIIARKWEDIVGPMKSATKKIRVSKNTIIGGQIKAVYLTRERRYRTRDVSQFERSIEGIFGRKIGREELRSKWIKLKREEAYQYNPAGTEFHRGQNKKASSFTPYVGKLRQGGIGLIHWSSQPGMPPAPDTETLRDSISAKVDRVSHMRFQCNIIADTPYARILELGAPSKGIAARPYIRPAVEYYMARFDVEYAKAMKKAIKEQIRYPSSRINPKRAEAAEGMFSNISSFIRRGGTLNSQELRELFLEDPATYFMKYYKGEKK